LRRLDAGSWFGSEFAGEHIPTLEEILDFAKKHDVVFYLELKPQRLVGRRARADRFVARIGRDPRTVVISFDAGILDAVRKIEPTLMTGPALRRPARETTRPRGGNRGTPAGRSR